MKINIQKFLKRVIPFVLSLTLLLLFVSPVSVSAAETSDSGATAYNLLLGTSYKYYRNGSLYLSYTSPSIYASGANNYSWSWFSQYGNCTFKYVYLTVQLSSTPSSVTFSPYASSPAKAGTLISHNGTVYQYRFTVDSSTAEMSFNFIWGSNYSGYISMVSCYASNNFSDTVSSGVGLTLQCDVIASGFKDIFNIYSSSAVTIPYEYEHFGTYSSSSLLGVTSQVSIPSSAMPYTYSPVFHFSGYFVGGYSGSGVSARLLTSSGDLYMVLPVQFDCSPSSVPVTESGYDFTKFLFTATVDLSGFDVSAYTLVLSVPFDPVTTSDTQGFQFGIDSILIAPPTDGIPWWVTLGRWLTGGLTSVKDAVSSGFDGLKSFMSDLWGAGSAGDDLISGSGDLNNQVGNVQDFEDSQIGTLDQNMDVVLQGADLSAFAASLAFVSGYAGKIFNGVSQYSIVFLLPVFLGIFFYICSRPFKLPAQRSEPEMTISRSETWVTSESQKSGNQRVTHTTTVSHHYPKEEVH